MDAALVTGWEALCQLLAPAFTRPTYVTFLHIATGWVLCRSRPTVTNLVCTIGTSLLGHVAKHWVTYERFFYRAAWSLDELSTLLLSRIVAPLVRRHATELVIDLSIDDTTCGRYGPHVAYASYFKDASASNAAQTVVHWAHNWIIGAVSIRPKRWPMWVMGLPVLFRLYRKPSHCDRRHPFRSRYQIAAEMIAQALKALPGWVVRVTGDGQYATRPVVDAVRAGGTNLVSRIRSDAALYEPLIRRKRRPFGRPAKRGRRLPSPRQMATRRRKGWRTVTVRMYRQTVKRRVLPVVCTWYRVCPGHPIKLLIVRDPAGQEADDFLFCTDPAVGEVEIIERFAARWPIEETIRDGKQYDGFERVQGWCARTVQRQAPLALIVQTLVKTWFLEHGVRNRSVQPKGTDWMPVKNHPSYLDMLATLRRALWTQRLKCNSPLKGRVHEILKTLQFTLCEAA